jgi:hypothetical protein
MTHQAIVLERGTVVHAGSSAALAENARLLEGFLGVGATDEHIRDNTGASNDSNDFKDRLA